MGTSHGDLSQRALEIALAGGMEPSGFRGIGDRPGMAVRIRKAREIAGGRFGDGRWNAAMTETEVERCCPLDPAGEALRKAAFERLGFTAGIFARALRVARTIADLDGMEAVRANHLAEALQYRSLLLPGPFLQGNKGDRIA